MKVDRVKLKRQYLGTEEMAAVSILDFTFNIIIINMFYFNTAAWHQSFDYKTQKCCEWRWSPNNYQQHSNVALQKSNNNFVNKDLLITFFLFS